MPDLFEGIPMPEKIQTEQFHELYEENISYVKKSVSAYRDIDFVNEDTLFRHPRERRTNSQTAYDYARRKKQALHLNFFKMYVDLYFKVLFGSNGYVQRNFGAFEYLSELENNIDGKNTYADLYFKNVGTLSLITSLTYVLTQFDNDLEVPRLVTIPFENVIDWKKDKYGTYEWMLIKDEYYEDYRPDTDHHLKTKYMLFSKYGWQWYDEKGLKMYDDKSNGENIIGRIPITPIILRDTDFDMLGDSFSKSLLECDIKILNILSLIDEDIFQSTFNLLILPEISRGMELDPLTGETKQKEIELGAKSILELKASIGGEKPIDPHFIAPDVNVIKEKRDTIQYLVDKMAEISGFASKKGNASSNYQSGISIIMDYTETNETIKQIAMQMENNELISWYYINLLHPSNPKGVELKFSEFVKEVSIVYPRDYNILDQSKRIEELTGHLNELDTHNYSITAKIKTAQQLETEILNISDEDEKIIYEEIIDYYKKEEKKKEYDIDKSELSELGITTIPNNGTNKNINNLQENLEDQEQIQETIQE